MWVVFVLAGLVVTAVVVGFVYFIAVNNLVAKKQAVKKMVAKLVAWQEQAQRTERIIQALLGELGVDIAFSETELKRNSKKYKKTETDIFTESQQQKQNLERVLGFGKNSSVLLRNDDFFAQERNIKELLDEYEQILSQRETAINRYNKAFAASSIAEFSGLKKINTK
ncbi:hypothetical protein CSB37_01040 [bacterium DOLZORAL124_38_8]|nr:MAG: hypothetical protein CSB37_01040 [bacterium DOLZORAL124_38_8]